MLFQLKKRKSYYTMSRRQFEQRIKINNLILPAEEIAENAELQKINGSFRTSESVNTKLEILD